MKLNCISRHGRKLRSRLSSEQMKVYGLLMSYGCIPIEEVIFRVKKKSQKNRVGCKVYGPRAESKRSAKMHGPPELSHLLLFDNLWPVAIELKSF